MSGWIGVDLDGTLAVYGEWVGPEHIGKPIPLMVERVLAWLDAGHEVKIFTARVCYCEEGSEMHKVIESWCQKHIGRVLPITCQKDYGMVELWDDRCVQVVPNDGRRADGKP